MSTSMRGVLEEELGWLICEAAQGGGKGKCDPSYCVCHGEAERLIAVFRKHGLTLSALSSPEPDRLSEEEP